MNPIFMSRADAIRTVLRAQDAASGRKPGAVVFRSVSEISTRLDHLDRLLLDVRAGRVDEFRIDTDRSQRILIKD